ncbi:sulfite exporter TauE/SafE family protein [Candidatus Poribacteria bacterium]|nr:MAG: sulfite exporter TauE/SafE family protein [Candidatus Poribacteria bacterium]
MKSYVPVIVLLGVIAGIGIWAISANVEAGKGVPPLTGVNAFLLALIGLLAGLLGGLIGTGGCSVMLPAIHFWMGYPAPIAIGTTLFAVIFTAISGGYGHLVRRNLDRKATLWLGSAGILGVLIGSWLFTKLTAHAKLLGLILGIAFLWPAVRMIWEGVRGTGGREGGSGIPGPAWGFATFGLLIGVLTGVVGLGGGYALVPGLIYLFKAPVYITMGTSLATMIPLAVVGGGIKLAQGFVALSAGLILAAGTVIGAQIGAAVIKRFKPTTLKLIFGLYFLYVSAKFITGYFGVRIW